MTYVLVAIVAAVLAAVAVKSMQKPEPAKRFGLKEAEAAASYLGNDPAAAKPVLGVVVGVLGFENKVDEDLQKLVAEKDAENAKREEEMTANKVEIERLEDEIRKAEAEVAKLANENVDAIRLVAAKAEVAALFQS